MSGTPSLRCLFCAGRRCSLERVIRWRTRPLGPPAVALRVSAFHHRCTLPLNPSPAPPTPSQMPPARPPPHSRYLAFISCRVYPRSPVRDAPRRHVTPISIVDGFFRTTQKRRRLAGASRPTRLRHHRRRPHRRRRITVVGNSPIESEQRLLKASLNLFLQ